MDCGFQGMSVDKKVTKERRLGGEDLSVRSTGDGYRGVKEAASGVLSQSWG